MTKEELSYIHKETVDMLYQMLGRRDWDCQDSDYQVARYHIQQAYEEGKQSLPSWEDTSPINLKSPLPEEAGTWSMLTNSQNPIIVAPLDFENGVITLDTWGVDGELLFFQWENEKGLIVYPTIKILDFITQTPNGMCEYSFYIKNVEEILNMGKVGLHPGNCLFTEIP